MTECRIAASKGLPMPPRKRSQPYRPRVLDGPLATRLAASGAVLLEGPKACGKTLTAEQQAARSVYLDTDDEARRALGSSTRFRAGPRLRSCANANISCGCGKSVVVVTAPS